MCVCIYMHVIISTNITDTVTIYNFFNLYIYFLQHKTDSALVSAAMRRFNFTLDSSSLLVVMLCIRPYMIPKLLLINLSKTQNGISQLPCSIPF